MLDRVVGSEARLRAGVQAVRIASLPMSVGDHNFNRELLRYLNRLSDLCWLLARLAEQPPSA